MIKKEHGVKALNIDIPVGLFDMYAKLCIDYGISKKEGIVQYFRYLQRMQCQQRKLINEQTDKGFKLDRGLRK
jgi:hypothetical protein